MNSENPSSDQPPRSKAAVLGGLHADELFLRALDTVKLSDDQARWIPPAQEELARLLPQYGIESLLGRGGMGAVYKGRQSTLDRPVAIKLLPAEMAADEQFVARFQREARTLARLQHPGIVAIYDFGQTGEGHLYFVMEFVEGTDLHQILSGPGLTPAQALDLISQVCDALHYAHGRGVIHRDIKPGNILVGTDGCVKLADFGLARPIQEESSVLTAQNVIMGTAHYMAPELQKGLGDQRADIYALGVMLYEMLTGQRPSGVFAPPSHRVQVDVRLDEVVLKALQQEPERRYQQACEMKTDVDRIRTTPQPSPARDPHATDMEAAQLSPDQAPVPTANSSPPSPEARLQPFQSEQHIHALMKIIISAALFTIIGLATGHFIATGFVGEYENNRSGYDKSYPSQEIWSCYGGGAAGGLAIGLVIGGIAVLVDRRTAPHPLKP